MARVYAAEEVMSRRRVAIKILRTELADSEEGRRRFLTEMAILANLDDPNIVRCLLCTEIEGRPVMVLERLEGWNLREMLNARVALPWTEMVHYALQIAKALQTAHSHTPAIVHRDLKPENVMVLPDGRVKVMDFGIAKILESARGGTTNHAIGTLQYMSPEHIDAQPIDGRSDLFSLGLMMWEMLAGRPPFQAGSPRELLQKLCTEPTPRLPDHVRQGLPPQVEALIFRLLEKDRRARPGSASEVVALLEPWTRQARTSVAKQKTKAKLASRSLDTIDIVEGARKGPLQDKVDAQAEMFAAGINRFAQATSALVVRVLVGLLVMPAAALIFLGGPVVLAAIAVKTLADDGIDILGDVSESDSLALPLVFLLATVVVFVRACWAHHRPARTALSGFAAPWWLIGAVLNIAWIATMAVELSYGNTLNVEIHSFLLDACTSWLMLTLAWVTGRIASRLFARLERRHADP